MNQDEAHLPFVTVTDVDEWVHQHGRKRLAEAMLTGQVTGESLRLARTWLARQEEREHRFTVVLVVAMGIAIVVTGVVHLFRW